MSDKNNNCSPARLAMVQWAARIGAVTANALAQRDGCALASARGRLQAAERAGLLAAARPLTAAPTLYAPTRSGLRAIGSPQVEESRVTASNAAHTIACAMVAAELERLYPEQRVTGERELRREEREYGAPLASARLGMVRQAPQLHRPDLVLWPRERALPLAVEVELTVKAPQRLLDICRAWGRCRCVGGVLYVTTPEVRRPLQRAIEKARAGQQIAVLGLDALGVCDGADEAAAERNVPSDA